MSAPSLDRRPFAACWPSWLPRHLPRLLPRELPRLLLMALLLAAVLAWLLPAAGAASAADTAAGTTAGAAPPPRTFWQTLQDGGAIGWIIVLLSVVSMAFCIENLITIRKDRLMPPEAVEELEAKIRQRKIDEAIKYCENPQHRSLLTNVILAGLSRFKSSEFGFAEYRAAAEEAGEEETARLYRKTEILSVIGAIAPMLGLLGTVQGMIEAFNTIAGTGGAARPADLAGSISKALVTTLEGLVVAIPTLSFLSYIRSRIDSLVSEAGKKVEQILLPLGRQPK